MLQKLNELLIVIMEAIKNLLTTGTP